MGNYVFDADALVEALHVDAERLDTKHDMGGDIIPYFVSQGEAGVYDFTLNDIPGSTERDRTYWRDVGTIDSFYDAHMDLISPLPVFNLYNSEWPIYTRQSISPPAKFVRGEDNTVGSALDSIVSSGVRDLRRHGGGLRALQRRLCRHGQPRHRLGADGQGQHRRRAP